VKKTIKKDQTSRLFYAIQGGKTTNETVDAGSGNYFDSTGTSKGAQESNRLRRAILMLSLEEVGQSVADTLRELCQMRQPYSNAEHVRRAILNEVLWKVGLRYELAEPDLSIHGYLELGRPDWLLRLYPGLAGMHPLTHPAIRIA
jgi:hypothetical protein